MTTTFWRAVLAGIAAFAILTPTAAHAQIRRVSGADTRQSVGVNLGGFFPVGEDGRVKDGVPDVLFENKNSLIFDFDNFKGFSFGGEYLFGVTEHIEAGADVSFYSKSVPSIYADVVHNDGREIEQDLKLRLIPFTASIRFIPTGRNATVQPYFGIGLGIINWRYTETGEFVDFDFEPPVIFRDQFEADGTEVAPVVIGGVRFLPSDMWSIGGELRWHTAEGDTGGRAAGFLADRIDLGGWTANFNLHFRF